MKWNRRKFRLWLDNLTSAKTFTKNARSVLFYRGLNARMRKLVRDQLRKVDPQGLNKLIGLHSAATRELKKTAPFRPKEELAKTAVVVREVIDEFPGTSVLRIMDFRGLKGVLAVAIAAGYSRQEVARLATMAVEDLNSLVTKEDVEEARQRVPNAIIDAADGIVMRDLLKGEVTPTTKMADEIAARRRKLIIDKHSEEREDEKLILELEDKKRKEKLKERFGADVQDAVVVKEEKV